MPATRTNMDREVKRAEILDIAEKLLLRDGYDATTMGEIARQAGVANNAVYWYFPGKDELMAAVLERRQQRGLAELAQLKRPSLERRVRALLEQLDQVATLTAAVHERAARSAAVAEQHDAFHDAAENYLRTGMRKSGVSAQDATRTAAAIMAMIEGIHLHEPPQRDFAARDRLVLWTLRRLLAASKPQAGARAASPKRRTSAAR